MTVNDEAESLIQQVQAAVYTSLENRERVAARCNAFADLHKSELESWRYDELVHADEFLQLDTREGTLKDPNTDAVDSDGVPHPTTTAARPKVDSVASEVFSQKTADDVGAHAKELLDKVVPGLLAPLIKAAGKGLWVYIAGGAAVLALAVVAKKKGWI